MKAVSVFKSADAAANEPRPDGKVRAVLRELAETCPDPAKLVELYYWSMEPDLLETLHRIIGLPDEPREVLRAFLAMVADCPDTVNVTVSSTGAVTLSSVAVEQLMSRQHRVS